MYTVFVYLKARLKLFLLPRSNRKLLHQFKFSFKSREVLPRRVLIRELMGRQGGGGDTTSKLIFNHTPLILSVQHTSYIHKGDRNHKGSKGKNTILSLTCTPAKNFEVKRMLCYYQNYPQIISTNLVLAKAPFLGHPSLISSQSWLWEKKFAVISLESWPLEQKPQSVHPSLVKGRTKGSIGFCKPPSHSPLLSYIPSQLRGTPHSLQSIQTDLLKSALCHSLLHIKLFPIQFRINPNFLWWPIRPYPKCLFSALISALITPVVLTMRGFWGNKGFVW